MDQIYAYRGQLLDGTLVTVELALLSLALAAPGVAQTTDDSVALSDTAAADTALEAVDSMEPRDAGDLTLQDFQWVARPIIVFADTPADPRFIEQLELLAERPDAAGIAVPGMPMGSPGMEMPGFEPESYEVFIFDRRGNIDIFASYP